MKNDRLDFSSCKFIDNKLKEGSMSNTIYERLYKEFDDDKTVHTVSSGDYNDPKLWEDPKAGFWIEDTPQAVIFIDSF